MKKLIAILAAIVTFAACRTTDLYYWGGNINGTTTYERLAYQSYDKQSPESLCNLIVAYEDMVTRPAGTRQVPPPGICAEYGYLLLQPGTAQTFAASATDAQKRVFGSSDFNEVFRQRGEEMMKKELELYPESEKFIAPLVKRFTE